jgi:phenylacetate-CoA ligase
MSTAYETLFRRVLFPLYERGLRQRKTLRYLAEYERNQWLPPEQVAALQWGKLSRLLRHCWDEVPYYRRAWSAVGATPDDIRSLDDFARLPLLTKADIRANHEDMHARSFRGRMLYKSTSGSTGEPLRLGYTRESFERRIAVMWRGYGWAGSRMGRRTLYLWGAPVDGGITAHQLKDRVYHRVFNRRILNTYLMADANMAVYADEIDRYRPEVIVGYVNPIVRLAQWLVDNQRRVHAPRSILGAAEAMHDFQRELIERAFGCKAYNTYGCREFMLIASECEAQDGLHTSADHLVVEVVERQPATDGSEVGQLAITDLHNFGMPFVRYLNGDTAVPATGPCACGRGLPRLAKVVGRTLDALRAADGRVVPGEFMPFVFNDIPGVLGFRVHQRAVDRLDISLVVDAAWGEASERRARAQIARVFGEATAVHFALVDALPLGPSGKARVTMSDLG